MNKYKFYIGICKKQKWMILGGFLALAINAVILIRLPFLMNTIIDKLMVINSSNIPVFLYPVSFYVLLFVAQIFINYFTALLFKKIGNRNAIEISKHITKSILNSKVSGASPFLKGDAMVVLDGDMFKLGESVLLSIYQVLYMIINLAAIFSYMLYVSPVMLLIIIVIFAMIMFVQKFINKKIEDCVEKGREAASNYTYEAQEIVNNYREYQHQKSRTYVSNRYQIALNKLLALRYRMTKITESNEIVSGLGSIANILAVFFAGVYFVINGNITVGNLIVFNMYSTSFGSYIVQIPEIVYALKDFKVSYERVTKILSIDIYENNDIELERVESINFKNIHYAYNNSADVIRNESFKLKKGNMYCVTGKNGSGKSTLISLLIGEYKPQQGTQCINNKEYDFQTIKNELEKHISYTSTKNIMYKDTIFNNLTLDMDYKKWGIDELLKLNHLSQWINTTENGLETVINEYNNNVSDGQKQKLSILRCLIDDKEILIFDEIEKNLDIHSKVEIINYLGKIKDEKIILIISHDNEIQKQCDYLIDLK